MPRVRTNYHRWPRVAVTLDHHGLRCDNINVYSTVSGEKTVLTSIAAPVRLRDANAATACLRSMLEYHDDDLLSRNP
jgi:hypothetical protein